MSFGATYTLEHWLDFRSDGTGMVQIDEPVGFDSSNFVVKQDKNRYGRDVSFSGAKAEFTFVNQTGLFDSPFQKLLDYDLIYGYESDVQYILREDGIDYVVGELDFKDKVTDQINEFTCSAIQVSDEAKLKRRVDTKVDLFSDEDIDGNVIVPVSTENILLKAKPVIKISEWFCPNNQLHVFNGDPNYGFNHMFAVQTFEIQDSLSWISDLNTSAPDIKLIEAVNNLTNVELDISNLTIDSNAGFSLYYRIGVDYNSATEVELNNFGLAASGFNQTYALPNISIGNSLWLYFKFNVVNLGNIAEFFTGITKITVKSTAIDSVTEGVRLIEAMRQVATSINPSYVVDAPRFEYGGEHYDNFIFNGNLIRGRKEDNGDNVPFVLSWKSIKEHLVELNCDYQINGTEIFVGEYGDFYPNTEIAVFEQAPDTIFELGYNDRYTINEFNWKYKKYNQDKDDENTIDGVHTESENTVQNNRVENTKSINVEFIRDPFMLETTRAKAVEVRATTSLSQDDQVFIFDVVDLPPNATNSFTVPLTHGIDDQGNLDLLNDGTFNWQLLGFIVGDSFTLIDTDNAGVYTIEEINTNILTLSITSITPSAIGLELTGVEYPLTNVAYTIRTDEGFDLIENILAPEVFGNLRYTIKRNILNYWGSYLKTASIYNDLSIRNTYFKNGGNLVSQYNGGAILEEKADIQQSELSDAIVSPVESKTKVLCTFEAYRDLEEKIKSETLTGTRGGFVRIYDNENRMRKGFVKMSDYTLSTEELELELEELFESEFTDISNSGSSYIINEVGYSQDIVPVLEYTTNGDYIQFFDAITRPLTNRIRYDFVTVNGVGYSSMVELVIAIESL
jgi:hypothetical protein